MVGGEESVTIPKELTTTELVESRLSPIIETDNVGFKRTIFHINGARFSFRGREELPSYPTLISSKTTLLGEEPVLVEPDKFQRYKEEIEKSSAEAPHFLATRTLKGVIELARNLGSTDSSLEQTLQELDKGIYSPRALEILDHLVAASYIGDDSSWVGKSDPYAEALVILSLLGDKDATRILSKKLESQKNLDEEQDSERKQHLRKFLEEIVPDPADKQPLNPKDLVAVHATRFIPKTNPSGEYLVETTFDATGGKGFRNTIHTSLNHKVEPVNGGFSNWSGADYTLISPLPSMISANGAPTCLNTVDTWWAQNPGEPLIFQNGTLVKPGGNMSDKLFEAEGKEVRYKSEGFIASDMADLALMYENLGRLSSFLRDFNEAFMDEAFLRAVRASGPQVPPELQVIEEAFLKMIGQSQLRGSEENTALLGFLIGGQEERQQNIEQRVSSIMEKVSLTAAGLDDRFQQDLASRLTQMITGFLKVKLNEVVVMGAIASNGVEIKQGENRAWSGQEGRIEHKLESTALEIGTRYTKVHSMTQNGLIDEKHRFASLAAFSDFSIEDQDNMRRRLGWPVDHLIRGDDEFWRQEKIMTSFSDEAGFKWYKFSPDFDSHIVELDQKTRRFLYASGVLNTRG